MKANYVTITPTGETDECGFHTGTVDCFCDGEKVLDARLCDGLQLIGRFQCDFEADGGLKLWGLDGKPIEVDPGYTIRILDAGNNPL